MCTPGLSGSGASCSAGAPGSLSPGAGARLTLSAHGPGPWPGLGRRADGGAATVPRRLPATPPRVPRRAGLARGPRCGPPVPGSPARRPAGPRSPLGRDAGSRHRPRRAPVNASAVRGAHGGGPGSGPFRGLGRRFFCENWKVARMEKLRLRKPSQPGDPRRRIGLLPGPAGGCGGGGGGVRMPPARVLRARRGADRGAACTASAGARR